MNFNEQLEEFVKGIDKPNILIIGRAGIGKTALINAVFGSSLGESGVPKHLGGITDKFIRYPQDKEQFDDVPVILYDSKGFVVGEEDEFLKQTFKFLDYQKKHGNEQIHLAWYVVNAASARFEHFDKKVIDRLNADRIPVIIVLNQCDIAKNEQKQGMLSLIMQTNFKNADHIVPVAAAPAPFDANTGQPSTGPFGLDKLVEKTIELLPKAYIDAFVAAQIVSIEAKRNVAYNYVRASAALCFVTGFVPIPFTTPIATYFAQQKLGVRLAALFGYDTLKNLPNILEEVNKSREAKITFWTTTILDLFVGEPVTSLAAGAAAASYLMVVGLALASTFEELAKLELDGLSKDEIEDLVQSIFREKFGKFRNNIKIRSKDDLDNFRGTFVSGN